MPEVQLTRRMFAASLAASAVTPAAHAAPSTEWIDLFNGRDLTGWRASENKTSWRVAEGCLVGDGPRSHLFYDAGDFRNFELEVEVMTQPLCNSGVYFHTAYQEQGFPQKGFEIQVNNTATGEGTYRERKKTGSLYGVRNVYKQLASDNEWFRITAAVRGKNVQIQVNGVEVVNFNEASTPVIAQGSERGRFLDKGAFALQCHDPGSKVRYRKIRARRLPDTETSSAYTEPVVDETYRKIIDLAAKNYPMVDSHVHLKMGLTLDQAIAKSHRDGIFYGIAVNCGKGFPVENDAGVKAFFDSMHGALPFVAMQAEGREWLKMFSADGFKMFDYVFTDSMTWSDNRGKRMRLWMENEVGHIDDVNEFMETFVSRTVGILNEEPIDIYVNPTFLPAQLEKRYDELWTEERMERVISAAKKNSIAIEINNRYKLPSAAFIKRAKAAGIKFTMGTNNTGPADLGRCEYGLQMIDECKLVWQDFFVPGAFGPKAAVRKA